MDTAQIIATINAEIDRLNQARSLLSDAESIATASKPGRGRPKGSKNSEPVAAPKKRTMSAEGKAKIAEAQRKRHAAAKKASK